MGGRVRTRAFTTLERGFTLLELMVVCAIIGAALMLAPTSFETFGARSRLGSAANTLLAQLTATKEQAATDGFEARLEIGRYEDKGGKHRVGTRYWYTNVPSKGTESFTEDRDARQLRATSRAQDRQWMVSSWRPLADGVEVSGISLQAGQWEKLGEGDRTFQVRYFPDASVERGFAVRLESQDMDVREEFRTVTVMVNPLTGEAASYEGLKELPKQRDAREFH